MIEFREVTKIYHSILGRAVQAVKDFSLAIQPGEVFGIAGPNGAGKSTLLSLLLGYLRPDVGVVSIVGNTPREYIERHGVGYMSELIAIPPTWTLQHALERYALLAGLRSSELRGRVEEVIDRVGVGEHRAKKVKQLSKGNLQRLGLAQALLQRHAVYIFDEPTHGLDPVWTQRFRDIVQELRGPDTIVFIASHNLDELERMADRVAIIDHGRLQRIVDTRRPFADSSSGLYHISFLAGHDLVASIFPRARSLGNGAFEIIVTDVREVNDGLVRLIEAGALITSMTPAYSSLEREFREAIRAPQP